MIQKHFLALCFLQAICIGGLLQAELVYLQEDLVHLRSGDEQEWDDFPNTSAQNKLVLSFQSSKSDPIRSFGLRRVDVKEGWQVTLNGQKIVDLFSDENDMHEAWDIPPELLQDGSNTIQIGPTSTKPDDIKIGQVWINSQSREGSIRQSEVTLRAIDENGKALPCRFTILDVNNALAAIDVPVSKTLAVRSGVIFSSTGNAKVGLRAGTYVVRCTRGFEYSLEEQSVTLKPEDNQELLFKLTREVDTAGLVACDTHVHTFEISRHGDASLAERMVTLAGEGIELAIATDHNVFVDYAPTKRETNCEAYFTHIVGNEVTTKFGHFNAFAAEPGAIPPNHERSDWNELLQGIRQTPNLRFVIMNHPRDVHSGFKPFGPENMLSSTGRRLDGRTLNVDAIELMNSAALQSDPMLVFHDWCTQLNRGLHLHAIGSSDSHEVSRKIVGQGRTYIQVDDHDISRIDIDAAIDALHQGRLQVSLGLLVDLTVNENSRHGDTIRLHGDDYQVEINVHGPAWCDAQRVELYSNGQLLATKELAENERHAPGKKLTWKQTFAKPKHDTHLIAVAIGDGNVGLHWPIAKPYQPTSKSWKPYLFGASGVIRLDCDSTSGWMPALEYARQLVDRHAADFGSLITSLVRFDSAVAIFAADEWNHRIGSIREDSLRARWMSADATTREAFLLHLESERASTLARSQK